MSRYEKLTIYVKELDRNYNFTYCSNENSTFDDLLESFSYNYPNLKICPCYKIEYYNRYNYKSEKVNMTEKVKNYLSSSSHKLLFSKENKECICDEFIKDYFWEPKMKIIQKLRKYSQEVNTLKNEIKENKSINNKLFKQLENQNQAYSQLQNDNKNLKYKNEKLKEEKSSLDYKNKELKSEIDRNKIELDKKSKDNLNLEKEKKELQQEIYKVEDKKDILVNKNENANKEINELKKQKESIEKQKIDQKKQIEKLINENQKLTEEKKGSEKTNKETNFIDFYDVIVDIKSVKDISQGWEIKMNENSKQKYEEFKKKKVIKIGVIGNANKGKSFLLSKISKIPLPSGTSIRTEGLSIKYPVLDKFQNRNIVLLDSAGLETPILKTEKEASNTSEDEIKEKDYFKEKSREKLITELFLQNYIINNSDILIIVVGILTYSEQKLLNRIRTEFLKARNNKNKAHRPLFIIHNLNTYKTIEQVEEYINDFLLKSATFDLEIGHKITTNEEIKTGTYYYETIKKQEIFHLIFAHDGSDAGNHYNNFTLDFLENSYQNVINLTNFDVIETIKDNFVEISQDILEKTENPITKESFENSNCNLIKLSNANGVTLKKCLIDELGFSNLKGNGFEPTYNCYKKGNKIIVIVEISGNCELFATFEQHSPYNIIRIKGEKKKNKGPENIDDTIYSNREFGKFSFDILINPEFCIKNQNPKTSIKNGLIKIEFDLEDEKKTASIQIDDKEDDE